MKLKKNQERRYERDGLTIIWRADRCFHSERCWRNLPEVFNPKGKPWIEPEGASIERIKQQIDRCPSGALTYEIPGEEKTAVDTKRAIKVEIMKNGPLLVHGALYVKGEEVEEEREKVTAFCRCGASANKPFCDGSHHKVDFKG